MLRKNEDIEYSVGIKTTKIIKYMLHLSMLIISICVKNICFLFLFLFVQIFLDITLTNLFTPLTYVDV